MFGITKSIDVQMKIIDDLRTSISIDDNEKAKDIFMKGEQLVNHASNGEFRKLKLLADEYKNKYNDLFIPTYFISRMFQSSLQQGHLMIASYIIDEGYPYQSYSVPNSIHQCLKTVEDHRGVDIIEFLENLLNKVFYFNPSLGFIFVTSIYILNFLNLKIFI